MVVRGNDVIGHHNTDNLYMIGLASSQYPIKSHFT